MYISYSDSRRLEATGYLILWYFGLYIFGYVVSLYCMNDMYSTDTVQYKSVSRLLRVCCYPQLAHLGKIIQKSSQVPNSQMTTKSDHFPDVENEAYLGVIGLKKTEFA